MYNILRNLLQTLNTYSFTEDEDYKIRTISSKNKYISLSPLNSKQYVYLIVRYIFMERKKPG